MQPVSLGIGPFEETGVGRRIFMQSDPKLFHQLPGALRYASMVYGGFENLAQVVQGCFFADSHPTAYKPLRQRLVFQIGKQVRFSRTETAGNEHPQRTGRGILLIRALPQEGGELMFRLGLLTPQYLHRFLIGHPAPQGFQRPPVGKSKFSVHVRSQWAPPFFRIVAPGKPWDSPGSYRGRHP